MSVFKIMGVKTADDIEHHAMSLPLTSSSTDHGNYSASTSTTVTGDNNTTASSSSQQPIIHNHRCMMISRAFLVITYILIAVFAGLAIYQLIVSDSERYVYMYTCLYIYIYSTLS